MSSDWRSADGLAGRWGLMIDDASAVAGGGEPATSASPRMPWSETPVARARRERRLMS